MTEQKDHRQHQDTEKTPFTAAAGVRKEDTKGKGAASFFGVFWYFLSY